MISQKKLEANRRNAQKSTGPKTEEGKAISSQNGLTHGLTSKKFPILPGENETEFREFHDAMLRDLKPRGVMQREIVDELVQVRWRLKRLPKIEAEMILHQQQKLLKDHEREKRRRPDEPPPNLDPVHLLASHFAWDGSCSYSNLELYRQRMQRSMHTLLRELRKLREETGDETEENEPTEHCPQHVPLPRYSGGGSGWGSTIVAAAQPPPQPSPGVPGEGIRAAHVTGERQSTATEDPIRKTEPTVECKPLLLNEKESSRESG